MWESENSFTSSDEKWADKLTKKRVIGFLIAIIGLLILIEFHAINKPVEERSVQNPDRWYEMLIGDVKDFVHDIANGNYVIAERITNGEHVEPFHTEKSSNENVPVTDIPSSETYTAETTFIAEWPGWNPDRQGSVDVEYDFDSDGVADYIDHVEYNGLTPGKQYTIQGRLIPKSRTEGVVYSTLIDENEDQVCDSEAVVAISSKKSSTYYVLFAVVASLLTGVILYSYGKKHWITSDTDLTSSDNDVEELDFSFGNDKANSLGKDIVAFQSIVEEDGTVSEYEEL